MKILDNLYYSTEHEWVRVQENKAYIGITDFAQEHLGDIVFVDLPEVDETITAGAEVGAIESVKAVSAMYSPVGGTIIEVNEELENAPELLNEDPYENFVLIVEMNHPEDVDQLMNAAQYAEYCEKEEQGGR